MNKNIKVIVVGSGSSNGRNMVGRTEGEKQGKSGAEEWKRLMVVVRRGALGDRYLRHQPEVEFCEEYIAYVSPLYVIN